LHTNYVEPVLSGSEFVLAGLKLVNAPAGRRRCSFSKATNPAVSPFDIFGELEIRAIVEDRS
jgi:hypothetical protein